MARNKKNISDFETALLSNTKIIKNSTKKEEIVENSSDEKIAESDLINKETLEKFIDLSKRKNIDIENLIDLALNHFINMESVFFDEY